MREERQNHSSDELTTVNELLRNLIQLVRSKDDRVAYLAAAAAERLTRLRGDAAARSFVQWNLQNHSPLTEPDLVSSYKGLIQILGELADALRLARNGFWLDPSLAGAASRVEGAWKSLASHNR